MQILATVCLLMLVSTVSTAIVLSGHGHDNNTDFKADPCVLAVPLESGFHSRRCATVLLVLVPGTERYNNTRDRPTALRSDADVPLLFELFAVVIATFAWQLNRHVDNAIPDHSKT